MKQADGKENKYSVEIEEFTDENNAPNQQNQVRSRSKTRRIRQRIGATALQPKEHP